MRMNIAVILAGFWSAASPAAAQTWDRSICPPELSNYGGCPVRVYVAPARPVGFVERSFGIVRKGYDADPEAPPVKARRNTGSPAR